jgi:hypothetical protein
MKVGINLLERKFQYEEYKRRLDVRQVLEHYDAENCHEYVGSDGTTEVVHSCLLDRVEPHHKNGDQNPSASVNLEKKVYCCYNYWSGDVFHLIAKMEHKGSIGGIVHLIGDFLSGATTDAGELRQRLRSHFVKQATYDVDLPAYSEKVLEPWMMLHPYASERGITLDAARLLGIGYDEADNRIVFPHFWQGNLVGWQKRSIPERFGVWPGTVPPMPKYRNSSGFPKNETLYAYDLSKCVDSVVVVESPMSVAKAYSLGMPNVVATFGASVNPTQIDLLKSFAEVTVWMDNDPAGRKGEEQLVRNLYRHTKVRVVSPEKDMDLADYDALDLVKEKVDCGMPAALKIAMYDKEKRYGRAHQDIARGQEGSGQDCSRQPGTQEA